MAIALKNAYAGAQAEDGYRILVDRLWPRGVAKERLKLDAWNKTIAPSTELRKWFGHDPDKWEEFKQRYFGELDDQPEAVGALIAMIRGGPVTFVFAARDACTSHALALREYLERKGVS